LVDDLLDVGRAVTGKIALERRGIDFCELVRRTVAVFSERHDDRRIEIAAEPVWVDGDPVRIEQIVSNIVGNAVKYTPSGGTIRVSLSVENDEAVLRVEDNGFGIAPELLPVVFDLFVQGERTLERSQGGLGIGLTLVRRLVTLHRGTVSASSEGPERGSTFTVRLPRVAVRSARSGTSAPLPDPTKRRVLIVEDNRDARETFRMMLELSGHEVLEAEEGRAGLELLKTEPLDVAFIDVGLPGLDGYEIARRFRIECGASVLLVALTGYGTPEALERSRHAGFDHHFIKPVNADKLNQLFSSGGYRKAAGATHGSIAGTGAANELPAGPSIASLQ
jgi:CheY-like chemotaxis protein/anti-sigma regulatory factor (Ser/Thr protein kinase)